MAVNCLTFGRKVEPLSCVQIHFELHIGGEGQLSRRKEDQGEASVLIQDVTMRTDSGLTDNS